MWEIFQAAKAFWTYQKPGHGREVREKVEEGEKEREGEEDGAGMLREAETG